MKKGFLRLFACGVLAFALGATVPGGYVRAAEAESSVYDVKRDTVPGESTYTRSGSETGGGYAVSGQLPGTERCGPQPAATMYCASGEVA